MIEFNSVLGLTVPHLPQKLTSVSRPISNPIAGTSLQECILHHHPHQRLGSMALPLQDESALPTPILFY